MCVLRCTQYLLTHIGGITKGFGLANFQMSLGDSKKPGMEMLKNICLAGLRILLVIVICLGASLAI